MPQNGLPHEAFGNRPNRASEPWVDILEGTNAIQKLHKTVGFISVTDTNPQGFSQQTLQTTVATVLDYGEWSGVLG